MFLYDVGESLEGSLNVAWHVQVDSAVLIVPFQVNSTELFCLPVLGDGVLGLQGFHEVVSMFFANIFDAEVIDNEAEGDGSGFVGEEAWNGGRLV